MNRRNKKLTFKNSAPFRSCISKISNTFIGNAEDLDIVIYNSLEYSDSYSMTSGSLWNYYRDEMNHFANGNNDANNSGINNNKTATSKSFDYKTKLIGSTLNNDSRSDVEAVVQSKYLRSLDLLLINCEIELDLSWSRYCVISETSRTSRAVPNTDPAKYEVTRTTNSATFQINNGETYVPVVTLSINDNIKFSENMKQRFKREVLWIKYRSEITTQRKSNN